jgi:hypothetical protein
VIREGTGPVSGIVELIFDLGNNYSFTLPVKSFFIAGEWLESCTGLSLGSNAGMESAHCGEKLGGLPAAIVTHDRLTCERGREEECEREADDGRRFSQC